MSNLKRILATALVFSLTCFVPTPFVGFTSALADEQPILYPSPSGTLSLAKPIPESEPAPEISGVQAPAESEDSTNFLSEGPLSASEEEDTEATEEDSGEFDLALSNDPFYGTSGSWGQSYDDLWWLKRVRADEAWSITRGLGSTVAVIDTGTDYNHADLAGNIWYNDAELNGVPGFDDDGNGFIDDIRGWDFHNQDNDPLDDNGHGSHVAGIIGAVADNAEGIAGVAPESKIMSLKVLDAGGRGYVTNVISAIRYAADKGAQVINMSLGIMKNFLSKSLQRAFENAVKYAVGKGTVVVAAAGNDGSNVNNTYPAAIRDVIAVGAIEPVTDNRAYFSNFGSSLDFVAPGVDVLSLRAGGTSFGSNSGDPDYSRASGTSMASPIVAGVVALLRSWNPLLTLTDVYSRLKNSAVDLGPAGFDKDYGWGLVDAFAALTISGVSGSSATSSGTGEEADHTPPGQIKNGSSAGEINAMGLSPETSPFPGRSSAFAAGVVGTWYEISVLRPSSPNFGKSKKRS
ncbi:MAG: S8 family serine peptidase [Candidatus Omnitrophica bacterium]|nr:S8 family serine peptidase [Candidatus Omnitrophota bacterium]